MESPGFALASFSVKRFSFSAKRFSFSISSQLRTLGSTRLENENENDWKRYL